MTSSNVLNGISGGPALIGGMGAGEGVISPMLSALMLESLTICKLQKPRISIPTSKTYVRSQIARMPGDETSSQNPTFHFLDNIIHNRTLLYLRISLAGPLPGKDTSIFTFLAHPRDHFAAPVENAGVGFWLACNASPLSYP